MRLNSFVPSAHTVSPVQSAIVKAARNLSVFAFIALTPLLASAQATLKLLYTINAYAGTGAGGNAGIPGPALSAQLNRPSGLAFDTQGNVYIANNAGNRVYKVDNLGNISVIVGTGVACPTTTAACGDGGAATQAQIYAPYQLVFDTSGNLYFTDSGDNRIREVNAATGVITTVVGTGTDGTYPSTTLAAGTSVNIHNPVGLAIDSNNNIFIADSLNSIIYKYATTGANAGKIQAYVNSAGGGGFSGDGGQAAVAKINNEIGLAIDSAQNLYIADQQNNRVRRVTPAGIISTIAGNGTAGYAGDGGTALNAEFNAPRSVAIDYAGDLIVSDSQNLVVRIVYATGGTVTTASYVETLAGSGASCGGGPCGDGGLAVDATFTANGGGAGGSTLFGFDNARGAFYVSDLAGNRVRSLVLSTSFPPTAVGATATQQQIGVQLVGGGATISSITIAPGSNGTQEFTVGSITGQPANTYEGTPALTCSTDGTTNNVSGTICNIAVAFTPQYPGLRTAQLKVVTSAGTFYYGISGKGTAPLATLKNANISSFAGTGVSGNTSTGTATTSQIAAPWGTAVDSQGNLYFADSANNLVRKVTPAGVISTIAGGAATVCAGGTTIGDGCAPLQATLNQPRGVALDATGNIYIADAQNQVIREISVQTGLITTIAGGGAGGTAGGLLATSATLSLPSDLAFDSTGNLYIADTGDNLIKVINSGSLYIFNYAGGGAACTATAACGDGGQAASATLATPNGIAVDPKDNLVIADTGNNRIRLVNKNTGVISTVVGTGAATYTGDGAAATAATLNAPGRVAIDPAGDYYIADYGNNVIRQVLNGTATPIIYAFAGNGTACAAAPACGDGSAANVANLNGPRGVSLDGMGNVYIADYGDNEIRKVTTSASKLSFVATPINTTSTDSPKAAYLQNIGNTVLALTQPTSGTNPSISTGFSEGSAATCPPSGNTLAVGTQCSYSVSFTPTTLGAYSGQLVESDNSLNAASTQTVTLNGTGLEDNPSVSLSTNPNPSTYNQAVTLSSNVSSATTPTGTVSFYKVGATQVVNMQATGASTTATQSVNLPAGTYSVAFVGTANGGLYNGWNSSSSAATNNLWTERYTLQLCATCATSIVNLNGNPGYATDTAALAAFQASPQLTNGAAAVGNPLTFTLTAPQVVTFGISDNSLGDDSGGLSLAVTALTALGSGPVNGGTATFVTANLPVGSTPIIAIYSGDTNNVSAESPIVTQVVNKDPLSNDTVAASPNPQTFGSTVTLTDSVLVAAGDTPPTGSVTFSAPIGGATTTLGSAVPFVATSTTTVISGITYTTYTASTTTTILPVGANTVTATYPGDANYAGGPLTTNEQITAASTPSTLTASPTSTTYGSPVTLTETITRVGSSCPTGPATFLNGATTLGTGVITTSGTNCVATLTTSNLPVGTDQITATVPASNGYAAISSGPTAVTIAKAPITNPTTPSLSQSFTATTNPATSPTTSVFGSPVILTYTIPVAVGDTAPSGTVAFTNGTTSLGTCGPLTAGATVNGITSYSCTATTSALPVGNPDTVTATYSTTDPNYAGGAPALTAPVVVTNPTTALTANPTSTTYGTPVTLTETIPQTNGACPTGPATFLNGATTLGTGVITTSGTNCVATLTTSNLPVGTDQITATVPASNGFGAISSGPTAVTIAKAPITNPTTPSLSQSFTATTNPATSPTTSVFGSPVILTYTIPVAVGDTAPSGTVAFTNGTTSLGTCGPLTAGATVNGITSYSCTATTSALPVGNPDTVTATYSTTDPNYAGGAPALTAPVVVTNPTTALTANPTSTTYGTPVTLTETIPQTNGACPTGPATFLNGATTLGTGVITTSGTNCVATLTTSNLPVGTDQITATVPASNGFGAISSGPTAVTIAKAPITNPTTPSLSQSFTATTNPATSPTTSVFGSPVILTYTIPVAVGDTAPSGTVAFTNGTTSLGTCGPLTAGATVNGITSYSCTATTSALPVGNPDTVTATYSTTDPNYAGGAPALTAPVVVTNPTTALTANPTSTTYGTPVTLTETIPQTNGACPTGPATFLNGATTLGTGVITTSGTNCVATLTTSNLPVGTDQITATVPASNGFGAISSGPTAVTIAKAPITNPTTPSLSQSFTATTNPATSPTTSVFGSPVILTYTIPVAVGDTAPSGTVAFTNGTTSLGTCGPLTAGATVNGITSYSCTATTSALPVGNPDTVTATYSTTDPNYAGGAPALTAPVVVTNPTTALTANPTSTTYGTPVTLTETIPQTNGACPTGPATFLNGATTLGTGVITTSGTNCVATLTTSNLPVGTDQITATVPASNGFGAISSGPTAVTIAKAPITNPTTPSLSQSFTATTNPATSPTTSVFGSPVILTYTIPVAVGDTAPSGTVAFTNGTTSLGTCGPLTAGATVNGITSYSCTATTSALPVGNPDTVTATYSTTDPNYAGGAPALTAPVVVTNPTTALTANPTSTTYGTPVTLTETIPQTNGACPTGPATFLNGATTLGTGVITTSGTNCVATLTTSNLPVGTDQITATVPASNGFGAISSGPTAVTIAKAPITNPTTPSLSQSFTATTNPATSPTTSVFGSPVILTYTIPVAVGDTAPSGTVAFTNGTTSLGTCGPLTAGATVNGITSYSCTATTSALPVGNPDTVTATYSTTDPNYAGGAPALTAPVVVTNPTTALTANPTSTTYGTPVTLTETIPQTNGACPTGPATFLNGATTLGTGVITTSGTNCVATLTTSNLPVGTDQITATVPASNGFGAISSGPTAVTIAVVNPPSRLTYGPTTPTCGVTLVTFTDTITPVNGVVPTGTVQFYTNLGPLGTPQPVVNGVATITIAVPCGTLTAYGVYTGNSPYGTSTTPPSSIGLADFTIAATPPSQTINPGDTVVYTISLAGANGAAFNSPVTLTATGLPADATVTFGTVTYVPGVGPTPTSMTIVTSPLHAKVEPSGFGPKVFYGLLLLPLLGLRRIRRKIRSLPKGIVYGLAALMMLGGLGAITGCAGGYFGPAGAQYTITVTGTSGTLVHSTTVALTVR